MVVVRCSLFVVCRLWFSVFVVGWLVFCVVGLACRVCDCCVLYVGSWLSAITCCSLVVVCCFLLDGCCRVLLLFVDCEWLFVA